MQDIFEAWREEEEAQRQARLRRSAERTDKGADGRAAKPDSAGKKTGGNAGGAGSADKIAAGLTTKKSTVGQFDPANVFGTLNPGWSKQDFEDFRVAFTGDREEDAAQTADRASGKTFGSATRLPTGGVGRTADNTSMQSAYNAAFGIPSDAMAAKLPPKLSTSGVGRTIDNEAMRSDYDAAFGITDPSMMLMLVDGKLRAMPRSLFGDQTDAAERMRDLLGAGNAKTLEDIDKLQADFSAFNEQKKAEKIEIENKAKAMVNELGEYPTTVDMEPIELANGEADKKLFQSVVSYLAKRGLLSSDLEDTPAGREEALSTLVSLLKNMDFDAYKWEFDNRKDILSGVIPGISERALRKIEKNKKIGYVAPEWQQSLQKMTMKIIDGEDNWISTLMKFNPASYTASPLLHFLRHGTSPWNMISKNSISEPDIRTFDLNGRQVVMDVANEPGIGVLETGEVVYGANVSDEEKEDFRRWVNGETVTRKGGGFSEEEKQIPRDYRIVDVTDEMEQFLSQLEEEYRDVNLLSEPEKLALFYNLVKNNSTCDLKRYKDILKGDLYIYNGEIVNRDSLGNIVYGYMGKHFGITNALLAVAPGIYDIAQIIKGRGHDESNKKEDDVNKKEDNIIEKIFDKVGKINFNWWSTFFDEPRDYARAKQGEDLWFSRH